MRLLVGVFCVLLLVSVANAAPRSPYAPVVVVRAQAAPAWLKLLRASGAAARIGTFADAQASGRAVLPNGAHVPVAGVVRFVRGGGRLVTADRAVLKALGVRAGPGLARTADGGRVLALARDPLAPPLEGYELLPSLGTLAAATLRAPPGPVREAAAVYLDPGSQPNLTPDQLAARLTGVRAAYVAGWDFAFLDRSFDYPYAQLIAALHARGIQAYAWLEPPEVGLGMWTAHPECREKTQSGKDAVVDWRSLIALESPRCFELAWGIWSQLLTQFDWDGVNVAELYFETGGPDRETPYSPSALAAFGGDPAKDPAGFATWRVNEVTALNRELVTRIRALRPQLDVQLTVIDDQLDPALGRGVGSDVAALAQVARDAGATLQVEDPFTTWTRGPSRYAELGPRVMGLMPPGRALFDLNVVPRANGHPTAQMTGAELALSVANAAATSGTVALYSAATMTDADLASVPGALAATASTGDGTESAPWSVTLRSPSPSLGRLLLDGRPWPSANGAALVPAGRHRVQWLPGAPAGPALVHLTGELLGEHATATTLTIRYEARARAFATFDRPPNGSAGDVVELPAGSNTVTFSF